MSNNCPHLARLLTFPESESKQTKHIVSGIKSKADDIVGYTDVEGKYIEYAKLIQDFVEKNGVWLNTILNNCYDAGINKHEYLHNVYMLISGKLHALMDLSGNREYATLLNGAGTLVIILIVLSELMPTLKQEDCIRHCEIIMKKVDINHLPIDPKDIFGEYMIFIKKYLNGEIELTSGGKLYCPVKYTPEGNRLIRVIIGGLYQHFPV